MREVYVKKVDNIYMLISDIVNGMRVYSFQIALTDLAALQRNGLLIRKGDEMFLNEKGIQYLKERQYKVVVKE